MNDIELTTCGINFGYQSPISQIFKDVEYKIKEDVENKTIEAIQHVGISVDKEELIKALQYDRNQYDKGYSDGRASIVEELEKIKEELKDSVYLHRDFVFGVVDNHIKELKGENK